MKKQIIIFLLVIICLSFGSYYYGLKKGVEAGGNTVLYLFSKQVLTQMKQHGLLLESLKSEQGHLALEMTEMLVENDIKHLDDIEGLLLSIPKDEETNEDVSNLLNAIRLTHNQLRDL